MLRSLDLRKEPSIRQSETILRRIEEELTSRGARVERTGGTIGGVRFRMPRPWQAPRLGILLAITAGRAVVSAGSGGPWRVRYELNFSVLRWITLAISAVLVLLTLGGYFAWDRSQLLNAIIIAWVTLYGIPYAAASLRFERLIRASAAEIIERRHRARPGTVTSGEQGLEETGEPGRPISLEAPASPPVESDPNPPDPPHPSS